MTEAQAPHSLVQLDPWLAPYEGALNHRNWLTYERSRLITQGKISLAEFASGHEYFGLHRTSEGWVLRERAPFASRVSVIGDCTKWEVDRTFDLQRRDHGTWELRLPESAFSHGQH